MPRFFVPSLAEDTITLDRGPDLRDHPPARLSRRLQGDLLQPLPLFGKALSPLYALSAIGYTYENMR